MWWMWLLACGTSDEPAEPDATTASPTDVSPTGPTPTMPTTPTNAAPPQLELGSDDTQLLALTGTLTLDAAGPAWVACTRDDLPEEVLLLELDGVKGANEVALIGATTEASYACEAGGPGGRSSSVSVTTPELPASLWGYEVTVPAAAQAEPFLTLFADLRACASNVTGTQTHVVMVDHEGAPRWLMHVPEALSSIDLDVHYLQPEGWVHMGGGWGTADRSIPHDGLFRTVDLAGRGVVERTEPAYGFGFNHHSERLADGTFLTLTFDDISDGDTSQDGVAVERYDVDADELVWSWTSQTLLDRGQLAFDDTPATGTWTANSAELATDPLGEGLYLSVVTIDEVWRIDPVSGDLTHRIGPHGDWSLYDADGNELGYEDWFFFQHDPEISADGRMLLHDNGTTRSFFTSSRVLELQLDYASKEATVLWEWTEPGWFNAFVGDADRLDDGTVSVTQGYFSCLSGRSGHSSVVHVDPGSDEVVWRLDWLDPDFAPYRSEHLSLCDVAPNARHCPEVAARVDALGAR
jgi:hypothetical protein